MLTTLIPPTSGTAEVAGYDVVARASAPYAARSATSARATAPATSSAAATSSSARAGPTVCRAARPAGGRRADRGRSTSPSRRRPQGLDPVRRPAPAPRHRDGPGARARAALPRRAVDRARPAEPGEPPGAHRRGCAQQTGMTIVLTTHYLDEADSMAEPGRRGRPRRGDRRRHRGPAQGRRRGDRCQLGVRRPDARGRSPRTGRRGCPRRTSSATASPSRCGSRAARRRLPS